MNISEIIVFTDGSSRGNPGPGGWAAVIVSGETVHELGGREPMTTNNRMELTAAIEGIKKAGEMSGSIQVWTDSQYLINGITKWVSGWQKNNWKSSQKEDVLNRDLWEKLLRVTISKEITWRHVRGHAGHDANERCDEIATTFADGNIPELYEGSRAKYSIEISNEEITEGKSSPIYLCLIKGKVERFSTWAECENKVKGVPGVKFKKVKNAGEEKRVLKEWGVDENTGKSI